MRVAGGDGDRDVLHAGSRTMSRRRLLASLGAAAGLLFVGPQRARAAAPRLSILTGRDGPPARGATLGIEEARHTADLLRRPLEIRHLAAEGGEQPAALVEAEAAMGSSVLVSTLGAPGAEEAALGAGMLVLDASPVHAPDAPCAPAAFRVGTAEGAEDEGAEPLLLWHPSLSRFGATQLNQRYRARFGEAMDGGAWAAWFGVKVAAESVLRAGSAEPAALTEFLLSDHAAFDGHKGRPLSFSASDHVLDQPVYVVREAGGSSEAVEVAAPPRAAAAHCGAPARGG